MRADTVPCAERAFAAMGTTVRVIVWGADPSRQADAAQEQVVAYDRTLSRFRDASELTRLNADPSPVVRASWLLRDAVRASLWAAERSGGLVDPCLLDALEHAGYDRSLAGREPARIDASGEPRPARPRPGAPWRVVRVDDAAEAIVRPPGVRLDLGGTGKGHVADLLAQRLAALAERWVVDCGGDVRVGGVHEVGVEHPLTGRLAGGFTVRDAAVATSSTCARAWRRADGSVFHHLLDPSTGEPACTGVLAVSAVARTTLEAETLAKTALLSGPDGARRLLARRGGLLVHAGGATERVEAGG